MAIHIGDVSVHRGQPPGGNPYRGSSLLGEERVAALVAWRAGSAFVEVLPERTIPISCYTFWFAPGSGGARRVTPAEVTGWGGICDTPGCRGRAQTVPSGRNLCANCAAPKDRYPGQFLAPVARSRQGGDL